MGAERIVLGSERKNALLHRLGHSFTGQVLEHAQVPLEVVAGAACSRWERWGLPAGALGAGSLLLLAMD